MDVSAIRERELSNAVKPDAKTVGELSVPDLEPSITTQQDTLASNGREEEETTAFAALTAAWLNASDEVRAQFLSWLAETQNESGNHGIEASKASFRRSGLRRSQPRTILPASR
jgi:hypothetical protein